VGHAGRFVKVRPTQKVGTDVGCNAGHAVFQTFAVHQGHSVGGAEVQGTVAKEGVVHDFGHDGPVFRPLWVDGMQQFLRAAWQCKSAKICCFDLFICQIRQT
jgi:hypothetical protein